MRSSARGVSLLEMLVVLAILGLVAALVLPTFGSGVSTSELRSSARQLAAGLRAARSEAVSQKRETFLLVDLEGRRFKVDRDPKEHSLPPRIDMKLFTAQRDIVDAKTGTIRFFPDGGSNGGRITVAAGLRKYDIDVDWLTGRVAILE
jgi:general secretion pathway protein H